jgi:hypothetical protein
MWMRTSTIGGRRVIDFAGRTTLKPRDRLVVVHLDVGGAGRGEFGCLLGGRCQGGQWLEHVPDAAPKRDVAVGFWHGAGKNMRPH